MHDGGAAVGLTVNPKIEFLVNRATIASWYLSSSCDIQHPINCQLPYSMAGRVMPTHNGPPTKSTEAPSPRYVTCSAMWFSETYLDHSLYLTNLPDKLQKPDLRLSLYTLFSTYGPVLDVVAMKTAKMRGQAHIVFRDTQASTQAMRALQGFDFFGKDMVSA
jgi:hypothetical protein